MHFFAGVCTVAGYFLNFSQLRTFTQNRIEELSRAMYGHGTTGCGEKSPRSASESKMELVDTLMIIDGRLPFMNELYDQFRGKIFVVVK